MTALKATQDIHQRRFSRNLGVALALVGLVVIILGLTVVKVKRGDGMERFDHVVRPSLESAGS